MELVWEDCCGGDYGGGGELLQCVELVRWGHYVQHDAAGLGGADVYVVLHDIDDEFCVAAGDGRDRDVNEVGESVVAEEREGGAGTGDEATTSLVAAGGGIVVRLGNVQCTVRSTRARSGGADGASQETFPHRFALRPACRRDQERAFPRGNRTTHQ